MRARQCRGAADIVRNHHRGGPVAVFPPSRRCGAAGGRPRRPARRHQRGRTARWPRLSRRSRSTTRTISAGASIRSQRKRPASSRSGVPVIVGRAAARRTLGDRAPCRPPRCAAAASPARSGRRARNAAGSSFRTRSGCSICPRRSCMAATSSTMPGWRSPPCARFPRLRRAYPLSKRAWSMPNGRRACSG